LQSFQFSPFYKIRTERFYRFHCWYGKFRGSIPNPITENLEAGLRIHNSPWESGFFPLKKFSISCEIKNIWTILFHINILLSNVVSPIPGAEKFGIIHPAPRSLRLLMMIFRLYFISQLPVCFPPNCPPVICYSGIVHPLIDGHSIRLYALHAPTRPCGTG